MGFEDERTPLGHFSITAQIDIFHGLPSFFERAASRPWVTLIELLLIGSVVYTVLRFLQGTRGARLVRAVLMILAVSFAVVWLIAEQFGFERINVLYPYFILGVFLISLVAFQTELRRLLIRLGEGGWMQRWFKTSSPVIDPIVSAVDQLSKKKIGALIAIERTTQMGGVTETGVRMDAIISAELIETIFWPGSALHDLGMIINQNLIVAAGCQFPLVESGDVDRSLGSRHRAALGMSYETDAVVIVVSEETGTISVAIRGRMNRALTISNLREVLTNQLTFKQSTNPSEEKKESTSIEPNQTDKSNHQSDRGRDGTGQAA